MQFASSAQIKMLRKLTALIRIFLEKKSVVDQCLNKKVFLKNEAHIKSSCRSAENSSIFTGKPCLLSLRKTIRPLFIDGP